jgi:TetR/AcrR family transcriptional repressor of mexJK operon
MSLPATGQRLSIINAAVVLGMLQGHKRFHCLMGLRPGLSEAEKEGIIAAAVPLFLKGHDYES